MKVSSIRICGVFLVALGSVACGSLNPLAGGAQQPQQSQSAGAEQCEKPGAAKPGGLLGSASDLIGVDPSAVETAAQGLQDPTGTAAKLAQKELVGAAADPCADASGDRAKSGDDEKQPTKEKPSDEKKQAGTKRNGLLGLLP